jgi:hypothetical protein
MPTQNIQLFSLGASIVAGLATRFALHNIDRGSQDTDDLDVVCFAVAAIFFGGAIAILEGNQERSGQARRRENEALRFTHERFSELCNFLEKIAKADSELRLANIIQNLEIIEMSLVQSGLEEAKIQEIKKLLNVAFTCRTDMLTTEDLRILASNNLRVFPMNLRDKDVAEFLVKCAKDFLDLQFDTKDTQDETRELIKQFIAKVQQERPNAVGILASILGVATPPSPSPANSSASLPSPANSSASSHGRLV